MEKNEIREPAGLYIYKDIFIGKLEDIIANLQKIYERMPQEYPVLSARFHRYEIDWSYGYYSEESSPELYGFRWETDEEYNKRLEKAKIAKNSAKKAAITRVKLQEQKEKENYERLKKKFEQ